MMRIRPAQAKNVKVLVAILVALTASERASAVILLQSEKRNTTPPPGTLATPWNLQGRFGNFNATPISSSHFIAARHIGAGVGQSFAYAGQTYTTTSFSDIAGTDLRVWRIDTTARSFPTWAPVWNPNVDGSEVGKPLVVLGRGTQRGEAIYAPNYPGTNAGPTRRAPLVLAGDPNAPESLGGPAPTGQGDLRGWKVGPTDAIQSWGQNDIEFAVTDDTYGELLGFNFDSGTRAGPNEAMLSRGDSSGGVFVQNPTGQWKLVGVNLGVDGSWALSEAGPYVEAAIFDARGLYVGTAADHQLVPQAPDPIPAASYVSRVSAYYGQLATLTNNFTITTGGGALVPEPTMLTLVAGSLCFSRRRRGRVDAAAARLSCRSSVKPLPSAVK